MSLTTCLFWVAVLGFLIVSIIYMFAGNIGAGFLMLMVVFVVMELTSSHMDEEKREKEEEDE